MTSEVEICNLALTRIGAATISSLSEGSNEAQKCSVLYGPERDALLRLVPWRFATGRQVLASLSDPPPEWSYVYQKPIDCFAARYIEPTGPVVPYGQYPAQSTELIPTGSVVTAIPTVPTAAFEIRGQNVYTHQPEAVLIYTKRVTDPTQFDPLFVKTLSYTLAAELVMAIRDDQTARDRMLQFSGVVLNRAIVADALDGTLRADQDADWIRARG